MKKFSEEKTQELLKGLQDENINVEVEHIDKFLQQNGVLVKVHIGRTRNYLEVNPKIFGVDINKSQELTEFFKDYIKNGSMTFIPNDDERRLHNIEAKVRTEKNRKSLGYDNEYMTIPIYKEFAEYVKKAREEYFAERDNILDKWDLLMERFKEKLKISLEQMNAVDSFHAYEQVINKLPGKEDYSGSFYMEISLRAFPVAENIDLFDEDIQEKIKEDTLKDSISSVNEILSNTLADCFTVVNSLLVSYDKSGKIAHKTMTGLKDGADRIKQKNLFQIEKINNISIKMAKMASLQDPDEIAEKAENVLAQIYGYAEEVGLTNKLSLNKSVLSEEELSLIYKSFQMEEEEENV